MLICGVVLLTHKKPEGATSKVQPSTLPRRRTKASSSKTKLGDDGEEEEEEREGEDQVLWGVGELSDDEGEDEDIDHHQHPIYQQKKPEHLSQATERKGRDSEDSKKSGEATGLMSSARSMVPFRNDQEVEMGRLR